MLYLCKNFGLVLLLFCYYSLRQPLYEWIIQLLMYFWAVAVTTLFVTLWWQVCILCIHTKLKIYVGACLEMHALGKTTFCRLWRTSSAVLRYLHLPWRISAGNASSTMRHCTEVPISMTAMVLQQQQHLTLVHEERSKGRLSWLPVSFLLHVKYTLS